MGVTAAVAGASGYAGGELLRLLLAHPGIELGPIAAGRHAGELVSAVHPHLPALAGRTFAATTAAALSEADLVFLALPHGQSASLAGALPPAMLLVDLGADHRLVDAGEWGRFYGGEHAPAWPYGLPELAGARQRLAESRRVAVPGCYPTATILGLAPLLQAGLVSPADLVVVAASGTSGAGRDASARLLGSEVMGDVSAYKVGRHQHGPEIRQALAAAAGSPVTLSFTATLAPMPRGLLATCTARTLPGVSEADLRAALQAVYRAEPFVHLLPEGRDPHTSATVGSNACQLQVTLDEDAGRAVVVAAIDNLGKGAAGQAVQCANLMLGQSEGAGLTAAGVAP